MALKSLGSLWVSLGLNTAKFDGELQRSTNKVGKASKRMRKSFNKTSGSVSKLSGKIIALAGPAAIGYLTKKSLENIDALAKHADAVGISTESLKAMHRQAELSGVSTATLDKSIVKMTRSIRDADDGLSTAVRAYGKLGLSAEKLKEMSPEEQFFTINQALDGVTNQTDRLAIATDIYGAKAAGILNMTGASREEFLKLKEELLAVGVAFNRIDANKVEQANDAVSRIGDVVEGVGNRIAIGISPYLTKLSNDFYDSAVSSQGWGDMINTAIDWTIKGIGFLADQWRIVEVAIEVVKAVVIGFAAGAVQAIEGVVSALNYLPGVNIELSDSFKEMSNSLKASFSETKDSIVELVNTPMPSEGIRKWADEAQAESERAAAAFAKTQQARTSVASKAADAEKKKQDDITKSTLKGAQDQFGITKAKDLAQAAANIPAAISGAYKVGAGIGGPLLGIGFGAAAGAYEAKKLSDIAGVSFGGGGGGGGSGGGGAPPPAATPTATPSPGATTASADTAPIKRQLDISLQGDGPHTEYMRKLVGDIAETARDMGGNVELNIT